MEICITIIIMTIQMVVLTITRMVKKTKKIMKTCQLKTESNIDLKMVLYTKVNGEDQCVMDRVFRSGLMVLAMRGNGEKTKLMAEANSGMLMEMYLMESGEMIKLMDMEFILM